MPRNRHFQQITQSANYLQCCRQYTPDSLPSRGGSSAERVKKEPRPILEEHEKDTYSFKEGRAQRMIQAA